MKSFDSIILKEADKASKAQEYPAEAFTAVRSNGSSLEVILIPKPARHGSGRKHCCHYDVAIDGEVIVQGTWEPCFETARALVERRITGAVTFLDHQTLKPRIILKNIEKAAKMTVIESRRDGPRFGKWHPFGFKRDE
jgi:hypothetical protein